jgi:hypothetical protein
MNNLKNDSFSSLNNADYLEERKNRSQSNIAERELDFKNSFLEWGANSLINPLNTAPT